MLGGLRGYFVVKYVLRWCRRSEGPVATRRRRTLVIERKARLPSLQQPPCRTAGSFSVGEPAAQTARGCQAGQALKSRSGH